MPPPKLVDLFDNPEPKKAWVRPSGAFRITDPIMADALNRGGVRSARNLDKSRYLIHVSDIIKTEQAYEFCARYHVLNYHSTKVKLTAESLSPGKDALFASGHWWHEYVIKRFMENSPFAQYAYGNWICNCKNHFLPDWPGVSFQGTWADNPKTVCKRCHAVNDNYAEIDLISKKFGLVGHPDFLLLYEGRFIVYEFKTIDRADLPFDSITQPIADHTLQASFYYYIMTELKMPVVPRVRVLYIDRSNSKLFRGEPYKEFKASVVPLHVVRQFLDKLDAVDAGKKSGFLPPRICRKVDATRAKNCEHCLECFARTGQYAKVLRSYKIGA